MNKWMTHIFYLFERVDTIDVPNAHSGTAAIWRGWLPDRGKLRFRKAWSDPNMGAICSSGGLNAADTQCRAQKLSSSHINPQKTTGIHCTVYTLFMIP